MAARTHPDVVLMDLQLGDGMDGVTATRKLTAGEGPRVLVLTMLDTDADITRAIGRALFISEATVKTHLGRISSKLGRRPGRAQWRWPRSDGCCPDAGNMGGRGPRRSRADHHRGDAAHPV